MMPVAALCLGVTLAAGLWPLAGKEPAAPRETIRTLKPPALALDRAPPTADSALRAMDEYRRFLALDTGPEELRAEATRRLADLNMEAGVAAEGLAEEAGAGSAYFREAVGLYESLLAAGTAPDSGARADEAGILYQLSRALEGAGDADAALRTLDRLVAAYPTARHIDEAGFRRGETYFVRQDFVSAERAYAAVLARGDASGFYPQALYKHGWSLFKLGRHEESLQSFISLLDRQLSPAGARPAEALAAMSRPERELLDDTLRVTSITYSYLDGAASIPPSLGTLDGAPWSYLLYSALGDLYLDKERYRDAAETYEAFVARESAHDEAPSLQEAAIGAYTRGKFPSLVLDAKRRFVASYGLEAPYWAGRAVADNPAVITRLKAHLGDLAAHDHAAAQASRLPTDYERAAGWYRRFLAYFPGDPESAERSFLLGELLFESGSHAEARDAYLRAAYDYPGYAKAAEAGYAALLASRELEAGLAGPDKEAWHEAHVGHALRFAAAFPTHPEAGAVLTTVAEELYAAGQPERAIAVAGLVVTLQPPATPALERVAWTVLAHARFDLGRFAEAEQSYQRLQSYTLSPDQRREVEGRVAASIYRQAEVAEAAGEVDQAVAAFLRIAAAAPGASIRPNALFDAATLLLTNGRWGESVALLQRFRQEFPDHEFNADVTAKLAVALKEDGQAGEAAAQYERIAGTDPDPAVQRAALWQAAELYGEAGNAAGEARLWGSIVQRFPSPHAEALEARHRLAELAGRESDWPTRRRWLESIVAADGAAGADRSDRSRYLAATAALELARPLRDDFLAVSLTMPLEKSLALKKARMEQALAAYGRSAAYGVGPVATAATFETAELYLGFSRALLSSARPADLDADEQEEYDLLLEEQAYPFEEKAIELLRANAERAADGVYDEWVRASFARLGVLAPGRYARMERSEDVAGWLD